MVPTSGKRPKSALKKKFHRYTNVFCIPIPNTFRYFLIDLDISLLSEAIDPFLCSLLTLSLFELFLNSITNFRKRNKARGLLALTIEDIEGVPDLSHLAHFSRR